MDPALPPATAPYMLRAVYKDAHAMQTLVREPLADLCTAVAGARFANEHDRAIDTLSSVLYYGANYWRAGPGGGAQTLGEEFAEILPVETRERVVTERRFVPEQQQQQQGGGSAAAAAAPPTVRIASNERVLATQAVRGGHVLSVVKSVVSALPVSVGSRAQFIKMLAVQQLVLDRLAAWLLPDQPRQVLADLVQLFFSAIFFLGESYPTAAHAMARITFVSLAQRDPQTNANARAGAYASLGLMAVVELIIRLVGLWRRRREAARAADAAAAARSAGRRVGTEGGPAAAAAAADDDDDEDPDSAPTGKCTLCLGARKVPTAAACGHIFCWECVSAHLANSAPSARICPLCRQQLALSTLVPLVRYRAREAQMTGSV